MFFASSYSSFRKIEVTAATTCEQLREKSSRFIAYECNPLEHVIGICTLECSHEEDYAVQLATAERA